MTPSDRNPLKEQVALLPLEPGVYQFLDRTGTVIYVGKAKSLRKRVSSYFMQNKEHPPKVRVLVRQIAEIRHIVVDSETDALLLENSLIKELQPRYNILLKDEQNLSLDRHPQRTVPEGAVDPAFPARRFPVFRSLCFCLYPERDSGNPARDLSVAYLLAESLSGNDCQREVQRLSRIPYRELQRSLASAGRARKSTARVSEWSLRCSKGIPGRRAITCNG